MKISTIVVSCASFVFFALNAMEERPTIQPFKQNPEVEQKFVRLDLLNDEGKSLYSIRVPYSFAQESSVIHNNLQFKEEEEGVEPNVSLPSTSISSEQLKTLEELLNNKYQQGKRKALRSLIVPLNKEAIEKLSHLITTANYIGNDDLLKYGIKELFILMRDSVVKKQWGLFFELISSVKLVDLQHKLAKKIRKVRQFTNFMDNFYKRKIERIKVLKEGRFLQTTADISRGKKSWLAAVACPRRDVDTEIREDCLEDRSNVHTLEIHIIDLETGQLVKLFNIKGRFGLSVEIKISPLGNNMLVEADGKMKAYAIETGESIFKFQENPVKKFCYSQDGSLIVALADEIVLYDSKSFELKSSLQVEDDDCDASISISHDNQFIAFEKQVLGDDQDDLELGFDEEDFQSRNKNEKRSIEIWDIQLQKKINEFESGYSIESYYSGEDNCRRSVHSHPLSFSSKKNNLAYEASDGTVKVSDVQNKATIADLRYFDKNLALMDLCAFSPNNSLLATAYQPLNIKTHTSKVFVWDLPTERMFEAFNTDFDRLMGISFSRDGDQLAIIGSKNKKVFLTKLDRYIDTEKLKNFSLKQLGLLWYSALKWSTRDPIIIPQEYEQEFHELPVEIKKYINLLNQQRGGPLMRLSYDDEEADKSTTPEKRKEVSEGEKKKPNLRPFKRSKKD